MGAVDPSTSRTTVSRQSVTTSRRFQLAARKMHIAVGIVTRLHHQEEVRLKGLHQGMVLRQLRSLNSRAMVAIVQMVVVERSLRSTMVNRQNVIRIRNIGVVQSTDFAEERGSIVTVTLAQTLERVCLQSKLLEKCAAMLVVVTGSLLTMALLPNVTELANILAAPITDTAGLELNIAPVRDALITDPELAL